MHAIDSISPVSYARTRAGDALLREANSTLPADQRAALQMVNGQRDGQRLVRLFKIARFGDGMLSTLLGLKLIVVKSGVRVRSEVRRAPVLQAERTQSLPAIRDSIRRAAELHLGDGMPGYRNALNQVRNLAELRATIRSLGAEIARKHGELKAIGFVREASVKLHVLDGTAAPSNRA